VRLAVGERVPVYFYGRTGGAIPHPRSVEKRLYEMISGKRPVVTDFWEKTRGGVEA